LIRGTHERVVRLDWRGIHASGPWGTKNVHTSI